MAVLAFGKLAPILADNVLVQYALLKSLNSHHHFEQTASIETIRVVAGYSPQFCNNLLDNLVQLLEGLLGDFASHFLGPEANLNTQETKGRIISLFSLLNHDYNMINRAISILRNLRQVFSTTFFQEIILSTLTELVLVLPSAEVW